MTKVLKRIFRKYPCKLTAWMLSAFYAEWVMTFPKEGKFTLPLAHLGEELYLVHLGDAGFSIARLGSQLEGDPETGEVIGVAHPVKCYYGGLMDGNRIKPAKADIDYLLANLDFIA